MLKSPKGEATVFPEYKLNSIQTLVKCLSEEPEMYLKSVEFEYSLLSVVVNSSNTLAYISREDGSVVEMKISTFDNNAVWRLHELSIRSLEISAQDNYLVTSSKDLSVCIWNLRAHNTTALLECSPWSPEHVKITRNEKLVCVARSDNKILIWDFINKTLNIELSRHNGPINCMILNGDQIISGSQDCSVIVCNLFNVEERKTYLGHTSLINCLNLSNNKEFLASGSSDLSIRVWSLQENKVQVLTGHKGEIYTLDFTSDDKFIASGSQDKTVRVWDWKTGNIEYIQDHHTNYVSYVRFLGSLLISASFMNLFVDDIEEKKNKLMLESHKSWISDFSVLKKRVQLISISLDRTAKLWDLNTEDEKTVLRGHKENVSCLLVTIDNKYIISGGWDFLIKIWDFKQRSEINTLKGHNHYVSVLRATNDSSKLISGSWDKTIKIWTIPHGQVLHTISKYDAIYFRLMISPNDKYFLASSNDTYIRMWDLDSYNLVFEHIMNQPITSILTTSNDQYSILSSLNGEIVFVNMNTITIEFNHNTGSRIIGCCLSENQKIVFICLQNSTIEIWDIESFKQVGILKGHNANWPINIKCLNQKHLALVSNDYELKIFNYRKQYECVSLVMPSEIKALEQTNCGLFLMLGCADGKLVVVNPIEKRIEYTYHGHTDGISVVTKTKRTKYIVSGSNDSTIIVWKVYKFMNELKKKNRKSILMTQSFNIDNFGMETVMESKSDYKIKEVFDEIEYPALCFNGFRQRINKKIKPHYFDCFIFIHGINLAHIYCYLGLYSLLEAALKLGCQIKRDFEDHSPLYYAISRNSQQCIDIILTYIINLSQNSKNLNLYLEANYAIRDDFNNIIQLSSPLIPEYIESLFIKSSDKLLPNSTRSFKPPAMIFMRQQRIFFEPFLERFSNTKAENDEIFVVFRSTPIKLNVTNGSSQCFEFLSALKKSKNHKIFTTSLVKTILDFKFRSFIGIIYTLSAIQILSLFTMICCIYTENPFFYWMILYLSTTLIQLAHELIQLKYEGLNFYIKSNRNYLDLATLLLILSWVITKLQGIDLDYIRWLMVLLNYLKGLFIFKSFDATRFYIGLLFQCISETYSFLIIFIYSTLALGGLNMASSVNKYSSFETLWKMPYELNFGVFNNDENFNIQYLYFILGSLFNIILMLNLLIAILGDSFDKYQMIAPELDYIEKLGVILEIESILSICSNKKIKGFLQLCEEEGKDISEDEWGGKIKKIENKINIFSKQVKTQLDKIEQTQHSIDMKLDKLLNKA